jgi:hypothetical protein
MLIGIEASKNLGTGGAFRCRSEEGRVREALSFLDTLRPPILKAGTEKERRECSLDWSLRFQAFAKKE